MFFLKKNYKLLICALILLFILAYATNITTIPDSIMLFENQEMYLETILGLKIEETVQVGSNLLDAKKIDSNMEKKYNLSLLGFNIKSITANIMPITKVIPLGNLIGLKLNTEGVLVVGISEVKGEDNKIYKPYEEAGISQGDSIIQINGEKIETTEDLIECVSKCKGDKIDIKYIDENEEIVDTVITPVKTSENTYKIGLWVRDTSAGIGTATFYDKSTNSIASLGHGIQDIDTEELVNISSGEFVTADVVNVEKGKENKPGKIEGSIEESKIVGNIYRNTELGVYGEIINKNELGINNGIEEVEVASRNEIEYGKATVICTLENGKREEYEIQIEKIYITNNENNKSMLVKVTDKKLLEKTGGIIQGMSGSPILQNGKIIGALTHVLVSDPTKGYALFADKMVEQLTNL